MKPLSKCSECERRIYPDDIVKTVAIIQSPQHIALVYKCPNCGNKSKVVASHEDWEERKEDFEHETNRRAAQHKAGFRVHQIELDAIDSADDLIALWASLPKPPLREAVMGACGCDDCKRKLYG